MYNGKSILAIILARGGSKGVPRKNIKLLSGKPMIAWSIYAARSSKYIDRTIVSTEDQEIRDISVNYGAEIPFMRPQELAKDDTPSVDPILYTLKKLSYEKNRKYDFILLLQPTSPLRNENHIDEAIETLINSLNEFDSLTSVTELEHPIYWNRIIDSNNKLKNHIDYDKSKRYRRQDFEKIYRLNGAIYLISTDALLKYKNFETENTMAYIMDRKSSIDIDSINDFELAEYYLNLKHSDNI
jgi:CMP-N-acetylneuraminic acid synthetase